MKNIILMLSIFCFHFFVQADDLAQISAPNRLNKNILVPYPENQNGHMLIKGTEAFLLIDAVSPPNSKMALLDLNGGHLEQQDFTDYRFFGAPSSSIDKFEVVFAEGEFISFWAEIDDQNNEVSVLSRQITQDESFDWFPVVTIKTISVADGFDLNDLELNVATFNNYVIVNVSFTSNGSGGDDWSETSLYNVISESVSQNIDLQYPIKNLWGSNGNFIAMVDYENQWGSGRERHLVLFNLTTTEDSSPTVQIEHRNDVYVDGVLDAALVDDTWFVSLAWTSPEDFGTSISLQRLRLDGQILEPVELDGNPNWVPWQLWIGQFNEDSLMAVWPDPQGFRFVRIHKNGFKVDGDIGVIQSDIEISEATPGMYIDQSNAIFSGEMKSSEEAHYSLYTCKIDISNEDVAQWSISEHLSIGTLHEYSHASFASVNGEHLLLHAAERRILNGYLVDKYGANKHDGPCLTIEKPYDWRIVPHVVSISDKYLVLNTIEPSEFHSIESADLESSIEGFIYDAVQLTKSDNFTIYASSGRSSVLGLAGDGVRALAVIDRRSDYPTLNFEGTELFVINDNAQATLFKTFSDDMSKNFDIAWLGSYYLMVWQNNNDEIVGQRVNADGNILDDDPFLIGDSVADYSFQDYLFKIVVTDNGAYIFWMEEAGWYKYCTFSHDSGPGNPKNVPMPDLRNLEVKDIASCQNGFVFLVQYSNSLSSAIPNNKNNSFLLYNSDTSSFSVHDYQSDLSFSSPSYHVEQGSLSVDQNMTGYLFQNDMPYEHPYDAYGGQLKVLGVNLNKSKLISNLFHDRFEYNSSPHDRFNNLENTFDGNMPPTLYTSGDERLADEITGEINTILSEPSTPESILTFRDWWKLLAKFQLLVANNRVVESSQVNSLSTVTVVDGEEEKEVTVGSEVGAPQEEVLQLLNQALDELSVVFQFMPSLGRALDGETISGGVDDDSLAVLLVQAYDRYLDVSSMKMDILAQRAGGKPADSPEYQDGVQFANRILNEMNLATTLFYHHLSEADADAVGIGRLPVKARELARSFQKLREFYPAAPGEVFVSDHVIPNPSVPVPLQSTNEAIDKAKQAYETSLQAQRTYDTDQAELRTEMGRLREQYLDRLFELTGEDPNQDMYRVNGEVFGDAATITAYEDTVLDPKWDNGQIGIQRKTKEKADLEFDLAEEVKNNISERKQIQQDKTAELIEIQNSNYLSLHKIDMSRGRLQQITRVHKPVKPKKTVRKPSVSGSVLPNYVSVEKSIDEIREDSDEHEVTYNPNAMGLAWLNTSERFIQANTQNDIQNANNNAAIENLDLDLDQAEIQQNIADVGKEVTRLTVVQMEEAIRFTIDAYLRNRESFAEAYYNNPTYRLLKDEKMERSDRALRRAQTQAYRLAKRVEYEWAERWPRGLNIHDDGWDSKWDVFLSDLSSVYQTMNPYQVEDFVNALKEWDRQLRQSRTNPLHYEPSFGQAISLRRHILGLDDYTEFGQPKPYDEVQENLRLFREYIAEHTLTESIEGFPLLDSRKDAILLTFPLNLLATGTPVSNYFSAADTWNHKLVGFDFNLVGSLQGFRAGIGQTAQLSLMQRGTSVLKLYSSELGYVIFNPDPYVSTNTDFVWGQPNFATYKHVTVQNAGRTANFKRAEFGVDQMYNRPVGATEWTLFIDNGRQVDLHLFWDQLEDIQILVSFRANAPPPIWAD